MRSHFSPSLRRRVSIASALLVTLAVPAHAAWQPGGVRLSAPLQSSPPCATPPWCPPDETFREYVSMSGMVPDGQQGAIVWWQFEHYIPDWGGGTYVETAQRIDVLGNVPAPWPSGGVAMRTWSNLSSEYIYPNALMTDGAGGAFYADKLFSYAGGEPRDHLQLHHVASNGSVMGLMNYTGSRSGPVVSGLLMAVDADGAGGVIYMVGTVAQRVDPVGNNLWEYLDPNGSPVWPRLTNASVVGGCDVVADGTGGGFFAWCEQPTGGLPTIYVQHLDGSGAVQAGWPAQGRAVRSVAGNVEAMRLASDGAGGVFIVWEDLRSGQHDLFGHGVLADGSLAPGIPANGRPLDSPQTNDFLGSTVMAVPNESVMSDEQGGLFVVRKSYDGVYGSATNHQLRLYRLDAALLARTGWAAEGMLLSVNWPDCGIAVDGAGGAFLAFGSYGPVYPQGLIGQHVSGDGAPAPGWTNDGYLLSPTGFTPRIVRSGDGAIVAWYDDRPGEVGIYAQRLIPDGPVAVQVSLVSAEVAPGEASLHWYVTGAAALSATVERRSGSSEWTSLGTVSPDGQGHVRYVDRTVGSGRVAYRLSWFEDGATRQSGEVWIDVPEAWKLALSARHANPGAGPAVFALTLPSRSPGSIELLDLQGRRVARRDLGTLDAGAHTVTIDEAATLTPGVYLARLVHGAETRTVRVVRVR